MVNDLLADRAQEQALEPAESSGANDDQRCIAGSLQQFHRRLAFPRLPVRLERGMAKLDAGNGFLHDGLGVVSNGVDHVLVDAGGQAASVDGWSHFPDENNSKARLPEHRFVGRGRERSLCTRRPVHAYHDRVHRSSSIGRLSVDTVF
jgi:hypothetical protein